MIIDWPIFIAATVALLLPVTIFISGETKSRLADRHVHRFRFELGLVAWQNWLDLGRALAGFYLLREMAFVFEANGENLEGVDRYMDSILFCAVAFTGLLLQTVHRRGFFYCLAPVFYLWGLTFIMSHWIPAVFALVFGTLIGRMMDNVEAKLVISMALLLATGYLTGHMTFLLILNGGFLLAPIVFGWIFKSTSLGFLAAGRG